MAPTTLEALREEGTKPTFLLDRILGFKKGLDETRKEAEETKKAALNGQLGGHEQALWDKAWKADDEHCANVQRAFASVAGYLGSAAATVMKALSKTDGKVLVAGGLLVLANLADAQSSDLAMAPIEEHHLHVNCSSTGNPNDMLAAVTLHPPAGLDDPSDSIGFCQEIVLQFAGVVPPIIQCNGLGQPIVQPNVPLHSTMTGMIGTMVQAPMTIRAWRYSGRDHNVVSGTPVEWDMVCAYNGAVMEPVLTPISSWERFGKTTIVGGGYQLTSMQEYKDRHGAIFPIADSAHQPPHSENLVHFRFDGTDRLKLMVVNASMWDSRGNMLQDTTLVQNGCLNHPDMLGIDYDADHHSLKLWFEPLQLLNGLLTLKAHFIIFPAHMSPVADGNALDYLKNDTKVCAARRILSDIFAASTTPPPQTGPGNGSTPPSIGRRLIELVVDMDDEMDVKKMQAKLQEAAMDTLRRLQEEGVSEVTEFELSMSTNRAGIAGCTDPDADNHNPLASDNCCCHYGGEPEPEDDEVHGCTDADAANYNPAATADCCCHYPEPEPEDEPPQEPQPSATGDDDEVQEGSPLGLVAGIFGGGLVLGLVAGVYKKFFGKDEDKDEDEEKGSVDTVPEIKPAPAA